MTRRVKLTAALTAATLVCIGGCNSGGGSSRSNVLLTATSGFPGASSTRYNLADDGQAFSNSGQLTSLPPIVSWNVSNGQAIAVFGTTPRVSGLQNSNILYAAWFDGTTWHKPVELHGRNEDVDDFFVSVAVLWLNTAAQTNANALARNGDAIILFTRPDTDVVNPTDEDPNVRCYGTYFDVSEANSPAVGTVQGGFDTLATIVDFDNVIDVANTIFSASAPDNDPDVTAIGFASDSLSGSHTLGAAGAVVTDSGDPTTFVHLLYRKDPTSGDPAAITDIVGARWWSVAFDLTQTGNVLPTADANDVIALGSALDTANNTEEVSQTITVHNGQVFATVSPVVQTPGGTDTALVAYSFSTAVTPTVFEVSSARADDSADVATLPAAANVYGADHGSASTLFFFEETGFQDDSAAGTRAENRDLMLGEIRISAAGVASITSASPLEIDGLTGTHDPADTDGDTVVVRDGVNGAVQSGSLRTRINRSGTAIVALWLQETSDATDADPAVMAAAGGTLVPNFVPWVTVVQVRRDPADARTLAQSVPAAGAQKSGALESDEDNAALPNQDDCADLRFQEGLAGGQATSQNAFGSLFGVPAQRGSSFQGNHLRVNWTFTQTVDQSGTDTDNDRLLLNGLTMTLPATPAPPTFALTNTSSVVVETLDLDYSADLSDAISVDAGDASGTAAGRVLVFFPSNETDELENLATSVDAVRYFVSEQGTNGTAGAKSLVSTDPPIGAQANAHQLLGPLGLLVVPVNTDTAAAPSYSGERIHLFWLEDRDVTGTFGFFNALRLATRSYEQTATTATPAVALSDRFAPALTTGPTFIDAPSSGDLLEVNTTRQLIAGRNGTTVGVYFDEDGHLLYQRTNGDATGYMTNQGVSAPALVDDDGLPSFSIISYRVVMPPRGSNLSKSLASWQKHDIAAPTSPAAGRIYVRVHD